jgi:hypothetical protein
MSVAVRVWSMQSCCDVVVDGISWEGRLIWEDRVMVGLGNNT